MGDEKRTSEESLREMKTELKSLQKYEECYRSIFENSLDAVLILRNRKISELNKAVLTMLGYRDKESILEKQLFQLSPKKQSNGEISAEKEIGAMDITVRLGSFRFEWTFLKSNGSTALAEVLLTFVSNENGEEVIRSTWRDLSERKSEERFKDLVETTSDFIWEVDRNARYTYASPRIKELLGYNPGEIIGKTPFDFMLDERKTQVMETITSLALKGESFQYMENISLHKNGTQVTLESSGVPYFNEEGLFAGYRGIDRDITTRKKVEEQLLLSESVFTNSIEGIAITTPDGTIQKVNKAFTDITGYSSEEALGKNPRILKSDRHNDAFYEKMWQDLITIGQWSNEIWNRKKDGSAYPEWLSISAIKNEEGEITNFISVFHDISEKKSSEEQLEFLAFHDPLTKLPNRRLFYDRLNISIQTSVRTESKLALLYMDIDNFKNINDSYGHPFGDEVLCRVKDRINSICRSSDTFARYGGDEFVIILNRLKTAQEAMEFSNRLIDLFKNPISIFKEDVYTSLSIGLAIFPDDGSDIIALEKNADLALYKAKNEGKDQVYSFHTGLKDSFLRKTFLINNLRQAVKNYSSFSIVYQPKVDAEQKTIRSVEALLRWNLDGKEVGPDEFIPIAEETNLIIPLGDWVLKTALSDMKTVHDSGYSDIAFSINLSTKQFNDSRLFNTIEKLTAEIGIKRSKLFFEITETAPMDNIDEAVRIMKKINTIGINFSMDDFGTGHSSLSNLKKFPLKELKIDRSFIMDIPHDKNDTAISKTIIDMAGILGCQVVAEGVETEAQLNFLTEHGCNLIQGYLFYKPLPLEKLLDVLNKPIDL
ncbi:MAG: EAL domain-containing protein [Spirochaetaceae bacterium]|nr:EAL domain-containing protein [Spirochaetaceae bacterium]